MPTKEAVMGGKSPLGLPFSPGVKFGQLVFISGQGPLDSSGKVVHGDIRAQTKLTLENFQRVVEAAGSSMKNTLQATVYLKDLNDYSALNEVYSTFFPEPRPARAVVQAELLFGMKVEVQGVAFIPDKS
jgi:2-iminobutanoate/2-iminopropanoate deaminase